ncbi:hypothetical protein K438DRAFT_2019437 [Mycena galopus ATCC 62051]|nr:hypothetical protein K438DRAFT_2019437 [Mycena galopus ATCC 62051]
MQRALLESQIRFTTLLKAQMGVEVNYANVTSRSFREHIAAKWGPTPEEIKKRKYRIALDVLELLIVERIFELNNMNQSETGYKMRKHIATLQARSKAVKSVIDRYNDAACALSPPMPRLTWEQVVEYAFLADFDILRDTRAEVQSRPWTRPAYRLAMDRYFKILRAHKEIKRVNVEIRRVFTWIRYENRFLRKMERNLRNGEGKSEMEREADESRRQTVTSDEGGAGYTARMDEAGERKLPEAEMHVSGKGETAKVPLLRPLAAESEFQGDRRALHEQVQYVEHGARNPNARAEGLDGTPAQRVEGVEEGWGDVHASNGKRGTATHDSHHVGKFPLRRTSPPKHARELPQFRIPTIEKIKETQKKIATHPRNNCPLPPQCVALAGVSSRAVEKGLISVQWCLRTDRAS